MLVNALEKFPAKKIYSHNAEYQPENDANQKNIGDTRYCMKQRAYYHLKNNIYKDRLRVGLIGRTLEQN